MAKSLPISAIQGLDERRGTEMFTATIEKWPRLKDYFKSGCHYDEDLLEYQAMSIVAHNKCFEYKQDLEEIEEALENHTAMVISFVHWRYPESGLPELLAQAQEQQIEFVQQAFECVSSYDMMDKLHEKWHRVWQDTDHTEDFIGDDIDDLPGCEFANIHWMNFKDANDNVLDTFSYCECHFTNEQNHHYTRIYFDVEKDINEHRLKNRIFAARRQVDKAFDNYIDLTEDY